MRAETRGQLEAGGYRSESVRDELRRNVIGRLSRARILPGLIGYDGRSSEIENALLSGHHIVLLGERGRGSPPAAQARRAARRGGADRRRLRIHCDPLRPICKRCRSLAEAKGGEPVSGSVERRYAEKLATPDVQVADLIGEIDPIKVAEGRYLADENAIHYGLIPRTNRGIFAINELPDLMEKIQVGLFNLMEERDVQIKGFKIRLPLDILIVASANPEDYTSRGRIITPLKDRFDVQIRTHYPTSIETEIAIVEQEVPALERDDRPIRVPDFMKWILGQLTFEARASQDVSQSSGVSVRVTINNYETMLANAERRAILTDEKEIVPRISDLHAVQASMLGKLEFEYTGEDRGDARPFDRLMNRAILVVFDRVMDVERLRPIEEYFAGGWGVEVSDRMPSEEYLEGIRAIPGLREAIDHLGPFESPALMATAAELVLEGLHLHQRLNKEREGGRAIYRG
jgi:magnesium chelatase subunit I